MAISKGVPPAGPYGAGAAVRRLARVAAARVRAAAARAQAGPLRQGHPRAPPEVSRLRRRAGRASAAPAYAWWEGQRLGYIEARKRIYVPAYARLARRTPAFAALSAMVAAGENVLIVNLDGPPLGAYPDGREASADTMRDAINDPGHPFGHGYVVAAMLAQLPLSSIVTAAESEKKEEGNGV